MDNLVKQQKMLKTLIIKSDLWNFKFINTQFLTVFTVCNKLFFSVLKLLLEFLRLLWLVQTIGYLINLWYDNQLTCSFRFIYEFGK